MSKSQSRCILVGGRALAGVAVLVMGGLLMHAQTPQTSGAAPEKTVSAPEPIFNMEASTSDGPAYSSSGLQQVASNTVPTFHLLDAQYGGGRQRYGRPKYHGGNTNPDGSPKWDFFVGGGFGMPTGDFNYATTSWGFGGGGGRMFNAHAGVNIEFNYDYFGMTGDTLNAQQNLYNNQITLFCNNNPSYCNQNNVQLIAGLDGNNHIWSFSLQPIYNLKSGEGLGAYVTGGAGFYHKVANFTQPTLGTYCDPFYGYCYQYQANQVIDHYTSNAFGIDGGLGVTYKFSRFSGERLYAEVRYVYLFNSARSGVNASQCTTIECAAATADIANDFPQNSQRTSYLPVKFGLRF